MNAIKPRYKIYKRSRRKPSATKKNKSFTFAKVILLPLIVLSAIFALPFVAIAFVSVIPFFAAIGIYMIINISENS